MSARITHRGGLRRVVTVLNADGSSVKKEDRILGWSTHPRLSGLERIPVSEDAESGVSWTVTRFAPGSEVPMHATPTTDYLIVLEGELELTLADDSSPIHLAAGDVLVQFGAAHAWRTPVTGPATVCVVNVSPKGRRS